MDTLFFDFVQDSQRTGVRSRRQRSKQAGRSQTDGGFLCKLCNVYVSSTTFLSGVQNRNHCPYCLWSRHLDLYTTGDRLSACKSPMKPIGLTTKATNKKYGSDRGELMLIHLCTDCESLSINRIAADDDPETIYDIFQISFRMEDAMKRHLETEGIRVLHATEGDMVHGQLFGLGAGLAEMLFKSSEVESV